MTTIIDYSPDHNADTLTPTLVPGTAPTQRQFRELMGQSATIDELNEFIRTHWSWFNDNSLGSASRRDTRHFQEYVEVKLYDMKFKMCSNSHSAPYNGGKTNWGGWDKDAPRQYPGWQGRILVRVKPGTYWDRGEERLYQGRGSGYFNNTLIYTGTGGGGQCNGLEYCQYQYDAIIWAADFPRMWEQHTREQSLLKANRELALVWNSLGGNSTLRSPPPIGELPAEWTVPDPLKPYNC